MRIGFLGPFSSVANSDYGAERQVGAIEQQILGLGRELVPLGNDVYISRCWRGPAKQNLINGVHIVNVRPVISADRGPYDSRVVLGHIGQLNYVIRASARMRGLDLDALIVHGVLLSFIASILLGDAEIPKVFVASNNDIFIDPGIGHTKTPILTKRMMRAINERCDALVALTPSGQAYLQSHGVTCRTVIPNAIRPDDYHCGPGEGFILTAAKLVPHKRIEDLVRAFSAIMGEIPERLVIVGSGASKASITSLVENLGIQARVRLEPFLPKTAYLDLLSKCSFFVLPSEAEAFGVSIIEAMASGKAVIARDTIGPKDIITHGENGYLFHSIRELSAQIKTLSQDGELRARLGEDARRTVWSKYSYGAVARQYQTLLGSMSNHGSRPGT